MANLKMVMDNGYVSETLSEAIKRYPEAERGLIFFFYASGLGFAKPTPKDFEWAARRCKELGLEAS